MTVKSHQFSLSIVDAPAFLSGMASYDVRQLTGMYAPSGHEDMVSAANAYFASHPTDGWSEFLIRRVIREYSGGAYDATSLWIYGAGHDAACNGLWRYKVYPHTGYELLDCSNIGDIIACAEMYYADGRPHARHTYGQLAVVGGRFFGIGGARYCGAAGGAVASRFDPVTGTWSAPFPGWPHSPTRGTWAVVHKATGQIIFQHDVFSPTTLTFYDAANETAATTAVSGMTNGNDNHTAAMKQGANEIFVVGSGLARKIVVDPVAHTGVASTVTPTGDTEIFAERRMAIEHDPNRGVYWMLGGSAGSVGLTGIYEVDDTTFATTRHDLSQTIPEDLCAGTYQRAFWDLTNRFLILETDVRDAPYCIRLPTEVGS